MDLLTWIKEVGAPVAITFAALGILFRMLQAYRDDKKSQGTRDEREAARDKREDERQNKLFDFLGRTIEQNTLQREAQERQNAALITAFREQLIELQRAFLDGLSQTLASALQGHAGIVRDVNAHTASALGGVETRFGAKLDDGLKSVRASQDALAAGIETQHQDNRAALQAVSDAHAQRETETHSVAEQYREIATKLDAMPGQLAAELRPILEQLAETSRRLLERYEAQTTPPVAPGVAPVVVAPLTVTLPAAPAAPAADAARVTVTEAKA